MEWRLLYPFIMFAGLTTAYFALRKRYQSGALTSEQRTAIGMAAFTGAMLGSKLPFLLESKWQDLTWSWLSDGKTIFSIQWFNQRTLCCCFFNKYNNMKFLFLIERFFLPISLKKQS